MPSLDVRAASPAQDRGPSRTHPDVQHWIGGQPVAGGPRFLDVLNPSTGAVISRVPLGGAAEVDRAVAAARRALPAWAATPIKERVQVFFRYKTLLERHLKELGALITEEHGKVKSEAEAEILKAIELTEFACSLPQIAVGESDGGEPRRRVPRWSATRSAWWRRSIRSTSPRWCRTGRSPTPSRSATASS